MMAKRERVLIGCERSGVIRRAFRRLGYDAWSCDLESADDDSEYHIQDDVLYVMRDRWDLAIMHPECTFLCNSGIRWLYRDGNKKNGKDPERWERLMKAAEFYRKVRSAKKIKRIAVENPRMHPYAVDLIKPGLVQFVQPWMFGDPFFKATGFELINLPKLKPTRILVKPKKGTREFIKWSAVAYAVPGPDRSRFRSESFPGIARAVASQWGGVL